MTTELPMEGKQGQPTTGSSAPGANQTSSNTGRAPVAGPSTHREKDPAAAQEMRPAAAAGTPTPMRVTVEQDQVVIRVDGNTARTLAHAWSHWHAPGRAAGPQVRWHDDVVRLLTAAIRVGAKPRAAMVRLVTPAELERQELLDLFDLGSGS